MNGVSNFKDIPKENLDALKLSEAHLNALQKENPSADAAAILKILQAATPTDTASNSTSGASTKEESVPFYKTYTFMGVSGVLLLALIAGGAYMMTHKTEETDL